MKIWFFVLIFPILSWGTTVEVNLDPCGEDTSDNPVANPTLPTAKDFCTLPLGSQCVDETNGSQLASVCKRVDNLPTVSDAGNSCSIDSDCESGFCDEIEAATALLQKVVADFPPWQELYFSDFPGCKGETGSCVDNSDCCSQECVPSGWGCH